MMNEREKQNLARKVRDRGVELTPDEAEEILMSSLAKIRTEMMARGCYVPESVDDMPAFLKFIFSHEA